jgi:hypothetical protein
MLDRDYTAPPKRKDFRQLKTARRQTSCRRGSSLEVSDHFPFGSPPTQVARWPLTHYRTARPLAGRRREAVQLSARKEVVWLA